MYEREFYVKVDGKEYHIGHPRDMFSGNHSYKVRITYDPENFKKDEIERYRYSYGIDALRHLLQCIGREEQAERVNQYSRGTFIRPFRRYGIDHGDEDLTMKQAKDKMIDILAQHGIKKDFGMGTITVADFNRFMYGGEDDYYEYRDEDYAIDSQLGWDWSDIDSIRLCACNYPWHRGPVWSMEFPTPHVLSYSINL